MKEVKEFLKDPKKKSLTLLGVYFIFFIFVFIVLSGSETKPNIPIIEEPKTNIENYVDMTSYNYKVTYTSMNKIDIIDGVYYNNTSLFTYNNIKYYYDNFLYVIDNDYYYLSNIEYNIEKIFNKNLSSIIELLQEEFKTTYKDGTIVTSYTIDSNKIYSYLYGGESFYTSLASVSIKENENGIYNIMIDLSSLGTNLIKIEVEYFDINLITNLEFNKDNYTYKESL